MSLKFVVTVVAEYQDDADSIFADAVDFEHLAQVMSDIAVYEGLPQEPVREGMEILSNVTFWGWLKVRGHTMRIESYDPDNRCLQSREHSPDVRQWDHHLQVEPAGDIAVWTDTITLDAGWRTPVVALFCRYMYRHRHKRRAATSLKSRIQPLRIR